MKKTTLYYILLSLFASTLNYLAYPMLARLLPPSQYVDITVALSLFTQMSTFISSLAAIAIGVSKNKTEGNHTLTKLQTSLLQIFTLLGVIFLLLSPVIMNFITTPVVYALPIIIMILVSIPITVISGYLNGRNSMVKLGSVAALTATLQFITGGLVAGLFHNGLITMFVMSVVQIISVIILVRLLREPDLPKITAEVFKLEKYSQVTRRLLVFTVIASFAIMIINVLQIADLLIIKNINSTVAKFYTDMYVISRIVFFGGMIFIWPFLGEVSLTDIDSNRKSYLKLLGIFAGISLGVIVAMLLFGSIITHILFGQTHDATLVKVVIPFSILYKMFFLMITACCLYFIIFRSYRCLLLTLIVTVITSASILLANPAEMSSVIFYLTAGSAIGALIGSGMLWTFKTPEANVPQ